MYRIEKSVAVSTVYASACKSRALQQPFCSYIDSENKIEISTCLGYVQQIKTPMVTLPDLTISHLFFLTAKHNHII
jgi:hypothetical protein